MDPSPEHRLCASDGGLRPGAFLARPCPSSRGSGPCLHQAERLSCPVPALTCSVLVPATSQSKASPGDSCPGAEVEDEGRWQAGGRVPQGLSAVRSRGSR